MKIRFHPHALERIEERGATEDEVRATVEFGEKFPAKSSGSVFGATSHLDVCGMDVCIKPNKLKSMLRKSVRRSEW